MRDRENVLKQCLGYEVKNFGKDVMETQSGEYGFICYWSKYENVWIREAAHWIRVPCVKWRMSYLQFVVVFVCSYEMQET